MFKPCQHRWYVHQQKTTQTMFAPLAFYHIKITVSQRKLKVTLTQISTHLYSTLLQKAWQNVEKGLRNPTHGNPTNGKFLEGIIPFSKEHLQNSTSVRNWNFLQLINLIKKEKIDSLPSNTAHG